ncbi:hypothetical protein GCM10010277_85560 [Streptomyces longisporoflavus]|nr:hypothetical protein GCM10010277_85560 [Streptomyces longisporoflavus]
MLAAKTEPPVELLPVEPLVVELEVELPVEPWLVSCASADGAETATPPAAATATPVASRARRRFAKVPELPEVPMIRNLPVFEPTPPASASGHRYGIDLILDSIHHEVEA